MYGMEYSYCNSEVFRNWLCYRLKLIIKDIVVMSIKLLMKNDFIY